MIKIYLKEFKDKKPENLKQLLKTIYNDDYNGTSSVSTYYDKDCKKVQCYLNTRRSIKDLLSISNTYFNEITENELIKELLRLRINKNKSKYPVFSYCYHIRKHVCEYSNKYKFNYFKVICNKHALYYPIDILKNIGIKNDKDLNNFLSKKQ